jgi:hypothetical protein
MTDVNIAVELLRDAFRNVFEVAILILPTDLALIAAVSDCSREGWL